MRWAVRRRANVAGNTEALHIQYRLTAKRAPVRPNHACSRKKNASARRRDVCRNIHVSIPHGTLFITERFSSFESFVEEQKNNQKNHGI